MPTYCYACGKCGNEAEDFREITDRARPMKCPACGRKMHRDFLREMPKGVDNHEFGSADVDRYLECKYARREAEEPVLSQSLARVPGLQKVRAKDGKLYAVFRNRQHRKQELKRMGLVEMDY